MSTRAIRFFVAPDGNDAWSGTLAKAGPGATDGPFLTPARARDAIRRLKSTQQLPRPVEVLIRGGTYPLSEPLVLGPDDSGSEQCPITYAAYGRGKPTLSGARRITPWRRGPGECWSAELDEVRDGNWYFHQLFVNGMRRSRPRVPDEGRLCVTPANQQDKESRENLASFRFAPGDIRKDWINLDDVEIVILQFWMEARLRIESIDQQAGAVRFTGPSWRPLNWSTGYYVENVAEALSRPGQWYLDRLAGVLTYWPLPRENLARAEVVAPACRELVRLEGDAASGRFVEHVRIRGLRFHYTSWTWPREGCAITQAEIKAPAAIRAVGARNCSFEDCEFAHLGGWGIELAGGCKDNRIVRNRFFDIGAGGIKVGEPASAGPDAEETGRTVISGNDLRDGAKVYLGSPAIWIGQSSGNIVSHNEIQGPFHWAVSVGWNWGYWPATRARDNIVEYNHCHHLGAGELGAHGALYALGVQPGTVLRNNLIHDVRAWPGIDTAASGCGIILDNACTGIVVENNVAYRCDGGGFCTNFNVIGNIIQNNVFALGRYAQLNRYGDPAPAGECMPNPIIFRCNIIYWDRGRLFWDQDWPNFGVLWDYNLYWDTRGSFNFMNYTAEQWKAKGVDRHSLIADPMFRDPQRGDFALCPASPAPALGFRAIDLSGVGPRQQRS